MLLISNDEAQVAERKKKGRPCPEDDLQFTRADLVPYFHPFILAELTVINTDVTPEVLLQAADDLRGERNLRQEIKHLLPLLYVFFHQLHVQHGLAAGSNTMQQADGMLFESFCEFFHGLLLRRRK